MKLYSEKEIGAILKRAAELSMSEAGSNAGGLSLEELQQIGREAGIDPDLILMAASELQNYAPPRERNVHSHAACGRYPAARTHFQWWLGCRTRRQLYHRR